MASLFPCRPLNCESRVKENLDEKKKKFPIEPNFYKLVRTLLRAQDY